MNRQYSKGVVKGGPTPPVHLIEHEVVGPTEHDSAGGVRLGALEEHQLSVPNALLGNLGRIDSGDGGVTGGKEGRGTAQI